MGINIVANFVSPAYDFANLFPKYVDFKRGGLITSVLAVLVCPWIFVDSPHAITVFVSVFGAILAPLYGVMVANHPAASAGRVHAMYTGCTWVVPASAAGLTAPVRSAVATRS